MRGEETLAHAWEEALEGLVLHENRQVVYLNPKAAQLLGVNREKVVGRPLLLALRDHRLEALALHGGERLLEVRGLWLRARALPGRLYLLDETEGQRRLQALEEATQTLAHELRTPLSGMGPLLEVLTPKTPQEKEVLALLKAEVARLARLVEALSPIRPGPKRPVALAELWPRLEGLLQERLKGRAVEVSLPTPLPPTRKASCRSSSTSWTTPSNTAKTPSAFSPGKKRAKSTLRCRTQALPSPSTRPSSSREGGETWGWGGRGWASTWCAAWPGPWEARPTPGGKGRPTFSGYAFP